MNRESFSKAMEDILLRFDARKSGLPSIIFPASSIDFDWLMGMAKEALLSDEAPKNIQSIYIWDENNIEVIFTYIHEDVNIYLSIIPYDVFMAPVGDDCRCAILENYEHKTWQ